jgi:hypothetical protein
MPLSRCHNKMEGVGLWSSDIRVPTYQTTRCHRPNREDQNLNLHRREKVKAFFLFFQNSEKTPRPILIKIRKDGCSGLRELLNLQYQNKTKKRETGEQCEINCK